MVALTIKISDFIGKLTSMLGVKYINTCRDEKGEGEVFTLNIL